MAFIGIILTLLMFAAPVHAANVSVTFCIDQHIDIADAEDVGDDFYTDNSAVYPARGIWLEVKRNSAGPTDSAYVADGGGAAGCRTLTLQTTNTYRVTVRSKNQVSGNEMFFYDNDTAPGLYSYVAATAYTPPALGETKHYALPAQTWWSAEAVATWAMFRNPVGVTSDLNFFLDDNCPGAGDYCCEGTTGDIYDNVVGYGSTYKAITVHEMGHCMLVAAGGDSPADYGESDAPCDYTGGTTDMRLTTKEYQGAAFWEGFATFYMATTFNNRATDECEMQYWHCIDWNADDDVGDTDECDPVLSCEGGTNVADEFDYLGDWCGVDDATGTELDWIRFFWDLTTNGFVYDVTPEDIVDIAVAADAASWTISTIGSGPTYPFYELNDAANTLGFGFDFGAWASDNGVTQ